MGPYSQIHIEQLVSIFLEDRKYTGDKIKNGNIKNALIVSTIGHRDSSNSVCDAIDREYKRWVIPEGLMMPWGKIVPIKAKRA